MSGISAFISNGGENSRVCRFEKERAGKTKEQIRSAERSLLVPEELPAYAGQKPPLAAKKPMSARSVKFVFHNTADMALVEKYFTVCHYVETCVAKPDFLLLILRAFETGTIQYNKETGRFSCGKENP